MSEPGPVSVAFRELLRQIGLKLRGASPSAPGQPVQAAPQPPAPPAPPAPPPPRTQPRTAAAGTTGRGPAGRGRLDAAVDLDIGDLDADFSDVERDVAAAMNEVECELGGRASEVECDDSEEDEYEEEEEEEYEEEVEEDEGRVLSVGGITSEISEHRIVVGGRVYSRADLPANASIHIVGNRLFVDGVEYPPQGSSGEPRRSDQAQRARSGRIEVAERRIPLRAGSVASLDLEGRNGDLAVKAAALPAGQLVGAATVQCGGRTMEIASQRAAATKLGRGTINGRTAIRAVFPPAATQEEAYRDSVSFDLQAAGLDGLLLVTSNGAVSCSGFRGECAVRSSNAAIQVMGHDGAIDAETTNGEVVAEGLMDGAPLVIRTSNASVVASIQGTSSPVDIQTSNDTVELVLPEAWDGTIQAKTSNGQIEITSPSGGTVSGSGPVSMPRGSGNQVARIRTSNANVTVTVGG